MKGFLTGKELREMLKLDVLTFNRFRREGKLPTEIKITRETIRYTIEDVENWLETIKEKESK